MKFSSIWSVFIVLAMTMVFTQRANAGNWNTGSSTPWVIPQTDPGGKAVNYGNSYFVAEMPENARPNDATIALYERGRKNFFDTLKSRGEFYTITPKGNAEPFNYMTNPKSKFLEDQLTNGYLTSYIYYDSGTIKYDGLPKLGRFDPEINDQTLFFTHSTGKSIVSYIVGHAICEGHISSIDEKIDWPLMSKTLYQGQQLVDLLNMQAGDSHTVDKRSSYIMGSKTHHRDMDLVSAAQLLEGTERKGDKLAYNNFLSDVIASYVVFKAGDKYSQLIDKIFQDKVKIKNEVHFQLHKVTTDKEYSGQLQTRASYSFMLTRKDLLRIAVAMMRDYQQKTCVGNYLRYAQAQAKRWPKYRPSADNSYLWVTRYARKYGAQFYFDFYQMEGRNILLTSGLHGQNILIDMDRSRIVVTQSAANAWNKRKFMLNVIRDGKLPN